MQANSSPTVSFVMNEDKLITPDPNLASKEAKDLAASYEETYKKLGEAFNQLLKIRPEAINYLTTSAFNLSEETHKEWMISLLLIMRSVNKTLMHLTDKKHLAMIKEVNDGKFE